MNELFTVSQLQKCKYQDKLPLKCYQCQKTFYKTKHDIMKVIKKTNSRVQCRYCSKKCKYEARITKVLVICKNCNKSFLKVFNKTTRSTNHFCRQSCSATYNNTHKTKGIRRSKLEIWLECKLSALYPQILIEYNQKSGINSELDIYFPSLKLAIELNGILHYQPIYGKAKLSQIQNNDALKSKACLEQGIELYVINVSSLNHFKEITAIRYLNIINDILTSKGV